MSDLLWTLLIVFAWLAWLWLLVKVIVDIVRTWKVAGLLRKVLVVLWIIPMILLPFFGVWVYLLVRVLVDDLVPRRDLNDGPKVLWILGFLFLPFVGVGIYLLTQRGGMTERGTRLAKLFGDWRTRDQAPSP